MQINPKASLGISDENSVTAPLPVNKKHKRMNRRGANADKWSDDETMIFIHVLHDDAMKHGFNGSTVSGSRWKDVIEDFWTRTNKKDQFSEERIKSKYQRLRADTKAFKDLLNSSSGYGWDPDIDTVTCPSQVWDAHIKQKKGISKFRHRGLPHYKEPGGILNALATALHGSIRTAPSIHRLRLGLLGLNEIFRKSFATGNHVVYSTNPVSPRRSNDPTTMENEATDWDDENVYRPMPVNTSSGSEKQTMCDMSMGDGSGTSTRRKKKKRNSLLL